MADVCSDRLDALLNRFPVRAHLFHAGTLCGINGLADSEGGRGQLHLVKAGTLDVVHPGRDPLRVTEPSLLMYPRPMPRQFHTDPERGADMACADLEFDGGATNPLAAALPDVVCVPLREIDGAAPILGVLFDEAFGENCGRYPLIDRLFEVVLIQMLRHLMETGRVAGGMLAGMSHPQLRRALVAMHEQPAHEWTLASLADVSGMSRSVFAGAFRDAVGCTPGHYLQGWRVRLTQQALLLGKPLKSIAMDVGYGSEAALSRAFKAISGMTPREWRQGQERA
ncbi:AraC family transcriptional regulator [Bordetella genomosp. 5]|uniref:AraC family transcriptional regulator n=1 Tax=Bordetella genomosp. 5 TaxID=1395608 RepID=UPI000B9E4500|nr:AraC family transcriptional regulator [Bordetella genomosp. 5]OZI47295.1 AraC family transcriptional regulator [Bordetella genomosp. 5]